MATPMNNPIVSQYLTQQIVRQRNSVTLNSWASYVATSPIPTNPDDAWIRLRIVADNIPRSIDNNVNQTLCYFLQDPAVSDNVNPWISAFNSTEVEQDLSSQNQTICGTFMPRYAAATVSQQQIDQWRKDNAPDSVPAGAAKGRP